MIFEEREREINVGMHRRSDKEKWRKRPTQKKKRQKIKR